jgi:lipopolysaccharide export system protein LptA
MGTIGAQASAAAPAGLAAAKPKAAEPEGEPGVAARRVRWGSTATRGHHRHNTELQKEGLVVFTGNVVANQNSSIHYSTGWRSHSSKGDGIVRTVSSGNVKIVTKDCKIGTAKRAEYYDAEQRVVLVGNARVWQEDNVVTGERITIFLAEDRSVVEGGKQERVKAVFYPRGQEQPAAVTKPPGAAPCG